ncbi:MAG: WxcM-like domain-containing protein [Proteobacteria bacterium]|nr:MAG: WxcM-like domain-containing protein [Pseudomonadota bacterium]
MKSKILEFKTIGDERGCLIALELGHNVPFDVKRVYYIFNTKKGVRRGFHAHKNLKQLAICTRGSCKFLIDDGTSQQTFNLTTPNHGLYIEGLVWREMFDFSDDCVLMVLADAHYDEKDYIRNYQEFSNLVKERK